ncbi:hypothetical protein JX265_014100, partial [Neoarthrinium moseri]
MARRWEPGALLYHGANNSVTGIIAELDLTLVRTLPNSILIHSGTKQHSLRLPQKLVVPQLVEKLHPLENDIAKMIPDNGLVQFGPDEQPDPLALVVGEFLCEARDIFAVTQGDMPREWLSDIAAEVSSPSSHQR